MLDVSGFVLRQNLFNGVISEAVDSARDFFNLPQEEKNRFSLKNFETDWADPGYFRKRVEDGYDSKQYFHHLPHTRKLYVSNGLHQMPHEAERFLKASDTLSRGLRTYLRRRHGRMFGDRDIETKTRQYISKSLDLLTIRYLCYDSVKSVGESMAKRHMDKCGITLALYSSHDGLQYETPDKRWIDLNVSMEQFVIFSSHQLWELTDREVMPLIHKVEARKPGESRFAIVVFVPFVGVYRIPRDLNSVDFMKVHGL